MSSLRIAAVLSTAALVSCFEGIPDENYEPSPLDSPDGDGNDNGDNPIGGDLTAAKELFDADVYPILEAKCSGGACHSETSAEASTGFVGAAAKRGWQVATNYTALIGGNHAATDAPVLTLIAPGTHKGITYSADETDAIKAWLDAEVRIRHVDPGQPVPPNFETLQQATERVRRDFVACMTLPDFQAANMGQAWGTLNAQNHQQCTNCHASGEAGFIATTETTQLFTALTTNPALLTQYFAVDLTLGAAAAKMVVNTCALKGVSQGLDPHRQHPWFNAGNNQGMTAVVQFYQATMARVNAFPRVCPPP